MSAASSILNIDTPRAFLPLLARARYKGAHGGRGSGKSHFWCEYVVEKCVMHRPTNVVCIREVQKSLEQSVKRLVETKIRKLDLGRYFRVLNTHIETPGDGVMIFQGMQNHTAESIKSLEGFDVSLVEEAQVLSQRSLDLLRPTIRKPGSELLFGWNPNLPTDPVDAFFRRDPPENSICIEVSYRDNPWFPEVLREDMQYDLRRDPEKYQHVWGGGYLRNIESRVFRNWRVGDPGEFAPKLHATKFYFGADWGFSVDPTVLICCYIEGRTLYVWREVYKVGCEIDNTPALFDTLENGMARAWTITADSARPETISYMQRHGFPKIVGAKKGAGSVKEGVEFLKNYDIVVHPGCIHTIDELTMYSYEMDDQTGLVLPYLADEDNNVIDSLRYSVEALRKPRAGLF